MRTDYSFARSMGKEVTIDEGLASSDREVDANGEESESAGNDINGKESIVGYEDEEIELDNPIAFMHSLDLRNLLGSSDKNVKKYSDGGSRFVTNFLEGIRPLSSWVVVFFYELSFKSAS